MILQRTSTAARARIPRKTATGDETTTGDGNGDKIITMIGGNGIAVVVPSAIVETMTTEDMNQSDVSEVAVRTAIEIIAARGVAIGIKEMTTTGGDSWSE